MKENVENSKIDVIVNGATVSLEPGSTVAAMLLQIGESGKGVAVAVGDALVPRAAWSAKTLAPGDNVVIIKAAYGG